MLNSIKICIVAYLFSASAIVTADQQMCKAQLEARGDDVAEWLDAQLPKAESYMQANISPARPGYKKGFVLAAPWVIPGVQNYQYHWVRDAALVMDTVVTNFIHARNSAAKRNAYLEIANYVDFSRENQLAPEPSTAEKVGLGEVKFDPDGSRYTQWMRPQNDGPALRAVTLMRFARELLHTGNLNLAKHLYNGKASGDGEIDAPGVIKADLDYVVGHWNDISFEPWEEVKGRHFYTNMVQRKALLDGAKLAELLGDSRSAAKYLAQVKKLESAILAHWIPAGQLTPSQTISTGQIWDTFNWAYGVDYKTSGLDVTAVLAALHGHNEYDAANDRFFSASDPRVLRTAQLLAQAFGDFPIARVRTGEIELGVPIGRYPEDKYDGYDSKGKGNPWYLATAGFAELYYRCAREWTADGKILIDTSDADFLSRASGEKLRAGQIFSPNDRQFSMLVHAIHDLGDSYMRTVRKYAASGGHLNEEFSRDDGSPQGAVDLSWSYASLLTAARHR